MKGTQANCPQQTAFLAGNRHQRRKLALGAKMHSNPDLDSAADNEGGRISASRHPLGGARTALIPSSFLALSHWLTQRAEPMLSQD